MKRFRAARTGRRIAPQVALCACFAVSCATSDGAEDAEDQDVLNAAPPGGGVAPGGLNRNELPVAVTYAKTAEGNWKRGNAAFEDEEYLAAQRYFEYIINKFSYKPIAAMARVRVGDCLYERKRYEEAVFTYETFSKRQPSHPRVPYALYRIANAYYEQLPGDWFIMPPSHEKDQVKVRQAERALKNYLDRFPKGDDAEKAMEQWKEVRSRLMAHERYVADFYRRLDRDRAYVGRLEIIRRDFKEVGLTDELLLEIVEVWSRIEEFEKAKSAYDQLSKDFPESELVAEAEEVLSEAQAKAIAKAETSTVTDGN